MACVGRVAGSVDEEGDDEEEYDHASDDSFACQPGAS